MEGAIVEIVSVVIPVVVVALSVTAGGEKLQLHCAGKPEHDERLMVPLKLFTAANVSVAEPVLPGLGTMTECGFAPTLKSGAGVIVCEMMADPPA